MSLRLATPKGGTQQNGSLLYMVVQCAVAACRMKYVVSKWTENEDGTVTPDVGCPTCYSAKAHQLYVGRIQADEAQAAAHTSSAQNTGIGMTVACKACKSRRVREKFDRCPNCGEQDVISIAEAAALVNANSASLAVAKGDRISPCVNCGTPKPERQPCPTCQKAS